MFLFFIYHHYYFTFVVIRVTFIFILERLPPPFSFLSFNGVTECEMEVSRSRAYSSVTFSSLSDVKSLRGRSLRLHLLFMTRSGILQYVNWAYLRLGCTIHVLLSIGRGAKAAEMIDSLALNIVCHPRVTCFSFSHSGLCM